MKKSEKLAIALGNELNMQIEGMEEKFKSVLIGIEAPNYLIVRMQIPSRFRNQIDEGTSFLVRYVYLGNLYGFKSKSMGSIESPYKLTFLSYPDTIESLDIRKAQRVSCFIPAVLKLDKTEYRGLIMEISKSGTRFSVNANKDIVYSVKINDPVKVTFPLLGFEGSHDFKGEIKSINRDSAGLSFGIQFIGIKPSLESMIECYVNDVLDLQ